VNTFYSKLWKLFYDETIVIVIIVVILINNSLIMMIALLIYGVNSIQVATIYCPAVFDMRVCVYKARRVC